MFDNKKFFSFEKSMRDSHNDEDCMDNSHLNSSQNLLNAPTKYVKVSDDLPESFDLREQYPYCETLREIRDQSKCGSCWAFSSVEAMSDRICIATEGKLQTRVSAQHVVTCCTSCGNGCFGGWPSSVFSFWKRSGIPSGGLYGDKNTCKPYFLPPCDDHMHKCHDYQDTPKCEKKCQDGYNKTLEEDLTYATTAYSVSGEKAIMQCFKLKIILFYQKYH